MAADFDIPKKIFILLFGKIHTGLYSKLSANFTWVAVIEYLERKRQQQCICNELHLFLVKVGKPTKDELLSLADAIADIWRKLGHCLGVSEAVLDDIDQDSDFETIKGYDMLMYWKRGATASYKVLNDALRHEDVQRQDLAGKICQG